MFCLFLNIISLLILWDFHIMYLNSSNISPYFPLTPVGPQKKIKNKTKQASKQTKARSNQNNPTKPLHFSIFPLSMASSFVLMAGALVCHIVYIHFCPINFTSKCSLQQVTGLFKASGFWYTTITGSSPPNSPGIFHSLPNHGDPVGIQFFLS